MKPVRPVGWWPTDNFSGTGHYSDGGGTILRMAWSEKLLTGGDLKMTMAGWVVGRSHVRFTPCDKMP